MPIDNNTARVYNPGMNEIEKQLREAIQASGQSLSQLGQASGVDAGRLSRFMRGERSLTLEAVGQLCELFGLHLAPIGAEDSPITKSKKKDRT